MIALQWKNFQVNLDKVSVYFKANLSANYDGLVCDDEAMRVIFMEPVSQEDSDIVLAYWDSVSAATFNPTPFEIASEKVNDAAAFGSKLTQTAMIENVLMGITQAGKTIAVSDYCEKLMRYLSTGSIYAALSEIERMKADDTKGDLAPFVTNERLDTYKSRIMEYMQS